MSQNIYKMITNQVIEKLEQGVVPWKKPFKNGIAVNWKTKRVYRGINTMLLDGGHLQPNQRSRWKGEEKGEITDGCLLEND